jgi:hypothetical protein
MFICKTNRVVAGYAEKVALTGSIDKYSIFMGNYVYHVGAGHAPIYGKL